MTWFKVDDGFWTHPKVDALGADQALAIGAWTLCGAACARDLTDGHVTVPALRRTLCAWSQKDRDRAVAALVRVRLWDELPEGGWLFHNWEKYQPSRSDVERQREASAERQRRSRETRSQTRHAVTAPREDEVVTPSVTRDSSVSHTAPTRPDPTRPDPKDTDSARGPRAGVRARGLGLIERTGETPPPTLGHLLSEHRRILQRSWVAERHLVEAWDGGGIRSMAKDVEVAKRILGELTTPEAITAALEGWARSPYGREVGFRMAAFAREPGSYSRGTPEVASASAPSSFAHCYDENGEPIVPAWLTEPGEQQPEGTKSP